MESALGLQAPAKVAKVPGMLRDRGREKHYSVTMKESIRANVMLYELTTGADNQTRVP